MTCMPWEQQYLQQIVYFCRQHIDSFTTKKKDTILKEKKLFVLPAAVLFLESHSKWIPSSHPTGLNQTRIKRWFHKAPAAKRQRWRGPRLDFNFQINVLLWV